MKNANLAHLDRLQGSSGFLEFFSFDQPFSAFKFVEERFGDRISIHRCLSLARAKGCRTVVIEKIQPIGLLKEENEELHTMGCWSSSDIYRLSFFSRKIRTSLGLIFLYQ